MLTIRCTRKLLKYLHAKGPAESIHPTTGLGDWYANLLFHQALATCHLRERTLSAACVRRSERPLLFRYQV